MLYSTVSVRIFNSALSINIMFLRSSVFVASLVATTAAQMEARENAPQCCEKLLSSASPAVEPFLALLGVTIPTPPVDLGVCCKPISVSGCDSNCTGGIAVTCATVPISVVGVDIGVDCTPIPPCNPACNTLSISTSQLFGSNAGDAFNDLTTFVGNGTVTTDNVPSIKAITFRYGSVIDGLGVTYVQGTGQDLTTISHGTSLTNTEAGLMNSTVTLGTNETITAVSGQTGNHSPYGVRVLQLSLTISNSFTGASRMAGPFGSATGAAFTVAGNGTLVALGGSAVNTNLSLNSLHGARGGLYGLSFITTNGTDCPR
ncbi:hypothetical protein MVEN_01989300 [Mycena venus]|uniref:Jacalin-type lectin domain-containing protein n=1 Tax=Mycena venus TaxID=2733690 RepID=A0A8H6XEJ5_9AGAR|nr:hypothetical protein MVEN_01989300 [Mycena venus]